MSISTEDKALLQSEIEVPLCVDLDGTLLKTDSLFELIFRLLKNSPFSIFILMYMLLKCFLKIKNAKLDLKIYLVKNFSKYVNHLVFNEELISFLREEKRRGRNIYLVTATLEVFAKKIVKHLRLFNDVFGSNSTLNLKGESKAKFLVDTFGKNSFIYAGNDASDLKVWNCAKEIIFVNTKKSIKAKAILENPEKDSISFDLKVNKLKIFLKTIRIHQWAKNILIFVPLVLAHKFFDLNTWIYAILAFLAFSLTASATYILNDILDIENDRCHKTKKHRALASGNINYTFAIFTMFSFFIISSLLAAYISLTTLKMLYLYVILSLTYSYFLKEKVIFDIIMLAFLYIYRLYFGAEVTSSYTSFYIDIFSMFAFLSLAALKRYVELMNNSEVERIKGRGYKKKNISLLEKNGIAASFMSILMYVLYVKQSAYNFYDNPDILMFGGLLILYFILEIWVKAHRGEVHEDPVIYAIKTKENYILLFLFAVIFILSKPIF